MFYNNLLSRLSFFFGAYIILRISITFLFFQDNPATGSAVSSLVTFAFFILIFYFFIASKNKIDVKFLYSIAPILLFLSYAGLSILWTHSLNKFVVFSYWVTIFSEFGFVFFAHTMSKNNFLMHKIIKGVACGAALLSFINLFIYFQGQTFGRLGDAALMHPNTLAPLLIIGIIFTLYLHKINYIAKMFSIIIMLLILIGLLLTTSKTSLIAMAAIIFTYITSMNTKLSHKILILTCFLVATIFSIDYIFTHIDHYLGLYHHDTGLSFYHTLTGRTLLWESTWSLAVQRPVLGYGMFSFRDVSPLIFSIVTTHAHNDMLQIFFSFGIVGLLLVVIIYYKIYKIYKSIPSEFQFIYIRELVRDIIIVFLIVGIAEANTFATILPIWLAVLIFSLSSRVKHVT